MNKTGENVSLEEDEEFVEKEKYLSFEVQKNDYALPIKYVDDIIGFQEITEVPDVESYIKGIINLRGQIIPILDMRERFQIKVVDYHARTCIIVVSLEENHVGLIVDEVHEVLDISEAEIQNITRKEKGSFINGVANVDEKVKLLVELESILDQTNHSKLEIDDLVVH